MAVLAGLSYSFPYGVEIAQAPLGLYISVALLSGGLWALLFVRIRKARQAKPTLLMILAIGLFMRGAMFFSIPVLEDDSYRYLWDGAVTANGIDPYKFAPAEAAQDSLFGTQEPEPRAPDLAQLESLAEQHVEAHSRINFPYVSTIYPPFAQATFAVAYWLDPFGLTGWRWVLLISDLVTFGLLLSLLKAYKRPAVWISLYWWNPVIVLQGFGAGHMDLLVLPFLLLALQFAKSERTGLASIALAGGAAVKIWPVLLFPFLLRPFLKRPVTAAAYTIGFGMAVLALLLPQIIHLVAPEAGLNAYASDWRTHAFLFAILEDFILSSLQAPGQAARLTVAMITVALTGYLALRFGNNVSLLPSLWAIVIATLIFLSPTGYPWYLIWLAPLLPFLPQVGLIAMFVLTPLYWLRFQFGDDALIYQWGIVPLAFGIPLALIALHYLDRRSRDAIRHHHPRFE